MLTPKVKKDFAKYCETKDGFWIDPDGDVTYKSGYLMNMSINMTFGIYQDYFWKEHEIWMAIHPFPNTRFRSSVVKNAITDKTTRDDLVHYHINKTANEARITAIKEASKLAEDKL